MTNIQSGYLKTKNGTQLFSTVPYPIGAIYLSVDSTNPSKLFGGTWELIDKEFNPLMTSSVGFEPSSDIKSTTVSFTRSAHTIVVNMAFSVKVALTDATVSLGSFVFEELGVTNFSFMTRETGFTDAGNATVMLDVDETTGEVRSVDVVGTDSVKAGSACFVTFVFQFTSTQMLDEACNKFYWKRTA